jgi:hypothetical protein
MRREGDKERRPKTVWRADGRQGTETLDRRQRTGDKEKRRKKVAIGRETRQICETGTGEGGRVTGDSGNRVKTSENVRGAQLE